MDAIGLVTGALTIPMVFLSLASGLAGLGLLVLGDRRLVLAGLAAALLCLILARLMESVVIAIDHRAAVSLKHGWRSQARVLAVTSGAAPMLVILTAEIICVHTTMDAARHASQPLAWLWAYGVATGPWTLFAARASRFRRTLASIRAYAAHVALWLFLLAFAAGVSPVMAGAAMLLPAILPFTVGMLLALADRDALTNVRI